MTKRANSIKELNANVELLSNIIAKHGSFDEATIEKYIKDFIFPKINDIFERKFENIEKWHALETSENKPAHIIHYTSLDTLNSIIENWSKADPTFLRMNDSFHLNDPEEGKYLTRHLKAKNNHDWLFEQPVAHGYIASFIIPEVDEIPEHRHEDDLAYWLAYGDRGNGCSIKFPIVSNRFRKVLYLESDVMRAVNELDLASLLESLEPLVENADEKFKKAARRSISDEFWKHMARIVYLYKEKAYQYERECRLVESVLDLDPLDDIHFNDSKEEDGSTKRRHFYNDDILRIDRVLITESVITLGPLVSPAESMVFYFQNRLTKAGFSGPNVQGSKIPYQ